jgi:hypothetical protein
MKINYKKRGNFILRGKYTNFYKCHNCGEMHRIDTFFRHYNTELDLSIINYIAAGIQDFSGYADSKYDMSLFADMDAIDSFAIGRQEFLRGFGLIEAKDSPVWPWLKHRLQFDHTKFLYSPKNFLVVLNLTPSGKIIGVQKRMFKGDNKYLTITLKKIYELLGRDPNQIPDEVDTISQLFNICLVNYSRKVTLFEGPLDSFLFKNSIANCGANKQFPIDIPLRYFYDDDKSGIDKSIQKINEGNEVFLWTKLKHDYELPIRKKWDLNDFLIWAKDNNKTIPNFDEYFSNDALDIIDI